ncbi:acyl-CoA dehydrogenase family protein [Halioglobus pacificus]|uniref:3-sulfinopropanoyl-CoA desulfinase n=1 Tax=Parahalioglobus pacificus TaxID=930806 RepID=A0A919CIM8_9GAMM|nr:acyl-CoA dehydrogenase family protein [Halioglobus pacificus]GHD28854.1 acyl-CoA dehydrogenase [Halioglobus pacificus]
MTNTAHDVFDLTLTDDQRMNRDTVRRFTEQDIRPLAMPADVASQTPEGFYQRSMELGLTLMPIPEALGGAGVARAPVSNVLNAEDLAHGDLSLALGSISPLAFVNTLLDQGTEAQRERLLPQFCGENFVAASTALLEPAATFEPTEPKCSAVRDGDEYVIDGTKSLVPLGIDAQLLLVIAKLETDEPAAFIVEGEPAGLTRTQELNMGLRTLQTATLSFDAVRVPASNMLGERPFDLERFIDLSRLGICALAVGTCQAVLDYVTEYCNERVAFGEPITNRQSVAFMIADIAIELEAMRLMTWRAASRAEQGLPFHKEAYLAKVFCGEHAMKIGTDGVQLLGGHGFCREHPMEMWYRNLRAISLLEGLASV